MTFAGWLQIAALIALIGACVAPLGGYMAKVFQGERTFAHPVIAPVERLVYRLAGVRADQEQDWRTYALTLLGFHALCIAALYLLLRHQDLLPLNPQGFKGVAPALAFNTAVSFVTNTSWQAYSGERTLSHLSQMVGIVTASFLSGAAGMAVAVALIRGFARRSAEAVGSYWVDQTRAVLYVLLPLSVVAALFLLAQGVPQTLTAAVHAATLEGAAQTIPLGPVASQEAIKLLSGDGGGFFNANSAHPFENPTGIANLVEMVLMGVIGSALTDTFGRMVGDRRQGRALLAAMAVLFVAGTVVVYAAEAHPGHALAHAAIAGGNMEGKEVRFGVPRSALVAFDGH